MQDNIMKVFIKYVSLNIAGQVAYSCYTMADTFFISKALGANGLTALNLAFPLFCIISGTGLMIGIGGGTRFSILKGRGDDAAADGIFTKALIIAGIFALVFISIGILASKKLVILLGADSNVFDLTYIYAHTLLLFSPAFLYNNLLQSFVRNDGNPTLSMIAMTAGCGGNIILDYIFIFPLEMGIFGAILATCLGPIISMLVLSLHFIRKNNSFTIGGVQSASGEERKLIASGIPPFLSEVTSGIVMFLFNFIILRITGNTGVAAFSVITVVALVVVAIYTGLSQGIQPILSRSFGEKNYDNVNAVFKYSLMTALILAVAIYSVIFFCCDSIINVFNSEGNRLLQNYAEEGMRLYFVAVPFIGLNIVMATYLISIEKTFSAQIISLTRGFFALIPAAFIMSTIFKMTGVWCSYPLAELITVVCGIVLVKQKRPCT